MSNPLALDLGSYAIKVLSAKNSGFPLNIARTVEAFNPLGQSLVTDESSAEKLGQLLTNIFNDNSLPKNDVRLALPESLVSTKLISIPALTDAELASAIHWQAEQHIPIPLEELSLEYQVVYRPPRSERNQSMRVLLVGARKSIIDAFLDPFFRAGIEPTLLETQTLALVRSLQFTAEDPSTLMVHYGLTNTTLSIVDRGELRFVYTFAGGGQVLTKAIEQAVQLDAQQAEEYKRSYGIDPSQLQGKLREVLLPALHASILEVQKAMQFFATQPDAQPIRRIVLSGGPAQLPGLIQYITEQLNVEVLLAAPFNGGQGQLPASNHAAFTISAGLIMREGG